MTATRRSRLRYLTWSLWVLWLLLSGLSLWWAPPGRTSSDSALGLLFVGYITVGALVAARHPRNAVGWILLAVALAFGVQTATEAYLWAGRLPGSSWVAWVASWIWYVWMFVIAVLLPVLFPDGRLLSRRWQAVLWLGGVAFLLSVTAVAFRPGRLDVEPVRIQNPLAFPESLASSLDTMETVGGVMLIVAALLTTASLVIRFRRAGRAERQQVKWFAVAGLVTLGGLTLAGMNEFVLPRSWGMTVGSVGWATFLVGALVGIPVATAVAILRYRLYDIDLVINKALVYGALTTGLLATYALSVLVLGRLLNPLTGDSNLAVAGSTLAVAALFRPARRRIQAAVDRRFYRSRYDAVRTVENFTSRLRHEVDLDTVRADLRRTAEQALHPDHVSLWIRP
jgi:hypothetical protein